MSAVSPLLSLMFVNSKKETQLDKSSHPEWLLNPPNKNDPSSLSLCSPRLVATYVCSSSAPECIMSDQTLKTPQKSLMCSGMKSSRLWDGKK